MIISPDGLYAGAYFIVQDLKEKLWDFGIIKKDVIFDLFENNTYTYNHDSYGFYNRKDKCISINYKKIYEDFADPSEQLKDTVIYYISYAVCVQKAYRLEMLYRAPEDWIEEQQFYQQDDKYHNQVFYDIMYTVKCLY